MRRNVTVDPLARAQAVAKPAIREITSRKSGRVHDTRKLIMGQRHEDLIRIRGRILENMAEGRPRFVCSECLVPVYLVASVTKAFFFRHRHEDGSCSAVTRNALTEEEIRARKYAGVQESDAHKRLKQYIVRSARADPIFGEPEEERHWRSTAAPRYFRRPDVSVRYGDLRIAFEGQLTTTFLSVVVGRKVFYRNEGALLVWVLSRFNPHDRRMTEDDILFPNNNNILVVDEETVAASEATGRFLLKCFYREPHLQASSDVAVWRMRVVGFDELTLDREGQRAFLVDVQGEERKYRQIVEEAKQKEQAQREISDEALRAAFLKSAGFHWEDKDIPDLAQREQEWADFRKAFAARGIQLPFYQWGEKGLAQLVKCLLSARDGKPRGWKFPKLTSVAHHIHDQFPGYVMIFILALRTYGAVEVVKTEDSKKSWSRKAARLRVEIGRGNELYALDLARSDLIEFLFPELMVAISDYSVRSSERMRHTLRRDLPVSPPAS